MPREITLSRHEVEILIALIDTGSIPAAAERLCISTATANSRLARLRARWRVSSTIQAAALAAHAGLLGDLAANLKKMH